MSQTWLSSPTQGGISKSISEFLFSHCVLLSALTYALSPTPLYITSHTSNTSHITQEVGGGYVEVIATSGDNQLGGDDFDAALVDMLLDEVVLDLQVREELRACVRQVEVKGVYIICTLPPSTQTNFYNSSNSYNSSPNPNSKTGDTAGPRLALLPDLFAKGARDGWRLAVL